jgi:hypothetical protein
MIAVSTTPEGPLDAFTRYEAPCVAKWIDAAEA